MFLPYANEGLYIAGPECFYTNGYALWWSQRKLAEYYGIPVVLPTSTELVLDHEDARENAHVIFDDLVRQVDKTTAIIADLEFFRGCEPDGGTIFEMGWIWARGGRVYGYTRDIRPMATKNQSARLIDGLVKDQNDWKHPYGELPFCPSIMGSSKLLEGDFSDILKVYLMDLDEERKHGSRPVSRVQTQCEETGTVIYLSGPERYSPEAFAYYEHAKKLCREAGFVAVCPLDEVSDLPMPQTNDPYAIATWQFQKNMTLLSRADILVANLSDFHGLEPNNDVSFECGVAYGWAKRCVGYMPDTSIMRKRIPHFGEVGDHLDWCGNVVENFDYPINLMFACTCPIVQGGLEQALSHIALAN